MFTTVAWNILVSTKKKKKKKRLKRLRKKNFNVFERLLNN